MSYKTRKFIIAIAVSVFFLNGCTMMNNAPPCNGLFSNDPCGEKRPVNW